MLPFSNRMPARGSGRVALIGAPVPLGAADGRLPAALDALIETVRIDAVHPVRHQARVLREGARAVTRSGCEAIHVFDPGFLPAALLLRARFGVPVSATLGAGDVARLGPLRRAARTLARRADQAFTPDAEVVETARDRGWRVPVTEVPPLAAIPPEPAARELDGIGRRLRDVAPERLVVGVPWPADAEQVRWYRDAVAPLLHGSPVCLLIGAPRGRRTRLLTGPQNALGGVRAHHGRLTADTIAAAARYVDAFVLPAEPAGDAALSDVLLALAASGVPAVIGGGVPGGLLAHERECLAVDPDDAMGMVSALNQVLALPSQQRHQLGYEFAAQTLVRWTADRTAAVYAERLAVLIGRPQIPVELRAAA